MRRLLTLVPIVLLTLAGIACLGSPALAASGDYLVAASSDDAEQRSSSTSLTSSDLELVQDGSTHQIVGIRFPAVAVPAGARVTRAYVQFTASRSQSTAVTYAIRGEAADNAAPFTTAATSVSGRPSTAATAAWTPPAWSSGVRGTAQQTADLSAVVQEVVARPGWAAGNALAIVITTPGTNSREAYSFDGRATAAPGLHVEWTVGTAPRPACSDGVDNDRDGRVDYPADRGCTSATDTDETDPAPPPSGTAPTPADYGFPACSAAGRSVVRPYPQATVLSSKWSVPAPPDDTTYDLTGVYSTAQPSTSYPFSFGTGNGNLDAGDRTCLVGGELRDRFGNPPPGTWEYYHDNVNAACVKGAAYGWYQILDTVCRGIEDGFRPQEPGVNANNARFAISDTYLGNVFDDCLEDDYTVGGVVLDSLWEGCYTGVSERPSSDRCWDTPADEQLVLDHLLLGLRPMAHSDGSSGYGRLFKWEKCSQHTANNVVIRCSTFLVPDRRVDGGADGMEVPEGTVVDDSACPGNPTTIVWLGGGSYPGDLRGLPIRVTADRSVWDSAVAAWKSRHGMT